MADNQDREKRIIPNSNSTAGKHERYLQLLLENSPDVIISLDEEGRLVFCSQVFLELAGIADFEAISGRRFDEVYAAFGDPAFLEQSVQRFNRVKLGRKIVTENADIDFSGKGNYRNYSINTTPILDEAGNFDGALVIYHDITDLLRAEADERIRVMFDSTPLACTFWDTEGKLLDCNQEALKLFEVATKEEFLRRFYDFSPVLQRDGKLSRDRIREDHREVYLRGRKQFEWLHRSAAGAWIPSEVTLVRVEWRDGYRMVGYTRDMRDIQAAEDKRREADQRNRELEVRTRAAQAASETKSRFLASMSHEIRTPMNAIIGISDLMRTDNLDETQLGFFTDIKKMSKALLQIINDILDISKIEMGKLELLPVHFNLLELYDNICSFSRFTAESKDLEFRHSFDPAMPHVIFGDDVRIRQVITNIVNNGIKYTREGYVDFSVKRVRRKGRDSVAFVVEDTGIGIKKEDFPKLFGTFQRLDGAVNRGVVGTGLGLSITKNLVDMMEGEIEFDSLYGKGSVFTVFLPLTEGDPAQVEQHYLKSRLIASEDTRVLVVDDNGINLKVALAFLAVHHIHADTAESGAEAVKKAAAAPYDLVFMDHMMPGMDGLEAVRRIRALEKPWCGQMPIIALSANAVAGSRETFLNAGMNDFISKPIDAGELNRKLAQWLPSSKISLAEAPSPREAPAAAPSPDREGLAVLDRDKGLANATGDGELYRQILAGFKGDHGGDSGRIAGALEGGDLTLAHRLAHTLKSTAGLIGALRVREAAFEIERALAEENTADAEKELPVLERELRRLLEDPAFSAPEDLEIAGEKPPEDRAAETAGPREREEALLLVEKLLPLLKTGNTECLELLGELKNNRALPGKKKKRLAKQIEDFEFKDALETLLEIKL